MINEVLRNDDFNEDNGRFYKSYRKKSYIVYTLMGTIIVILLILVFLMPSKSDQIICDSFEF